MIRTITSRTELINKDLMPTVVPNFMEQVQKFEQQPDGSKGNLVISNNKEFRRINEFISAYYNTKDLPLTKW